LRGAGSKANKPGERFQEQARAYLQGIPEICANPGNRVLHVSKVTKDRLGCKIVIMHNQTGEAIGLDAGYWPLLKGYRLFCRDPQSMIVGVFPYGPGDFNAHVRVFAMPRILQP
jgi:hypothetical protein